MSHLSALSITVHPSIDYRRLVWILTGIAIIGLYYAATPWWLDGLLWVGMFWAVWHVLRCPRPHPDLQTIQFQQAKWHLISNEEDLIYETIQICLDTGFFVLIHFSGSAFNPSRFIVLFYDQIPQYELRMLFVLNSTSKLSKKNRSQS